METSVTRTQEHTLSPGLFTYTHAHTSNNGDGDQFNMHHSLSLSLSTHTHLQQWQLGPIRHTSWPISVVWHTGTWMRRYLDENCRSWMSHVARRKESCNSYEWGKPWWGTQCLSPMQSYPESSRLRASLGMCCRRARRRPCQLGEHAQRPWATRSKCQRRTIIWRTRRKFETDNIACIAKQKLLHVQTYVVGPKWWEQIGRRPGARRRRV